MDSTIDSGCIEWYPIRQLLGYPGYEFTLIVLNQPIQDPALFNDLWNAASTKIAADGGANQIYDFSKQSQVANGDTNPNPHDQYRDLDTIIGDLDSLRPESRAHFAPHTHIIHEADQYSTDFGKAVRLARREAPGRDLICLGGLGGRVDQGLSQLHHLYLFQKSPTYADGRVFLVSGDSLSFVLKGGQRHRIHVREPGLRVVGRTTTHVHLDYTEPFSKYVGIVPVGDKAVISTKGLEWDVRDWPTEFGGQMSTSNHVLPETTVVEVCTDKDVLFTIAMK
ncbi:thiamine pyrophosphokinase [Xylaria sp. CBS 124048]|nr:thiamine pyrophosphokinase [Xylaria sp. CBS 124048]